NRPTSREILKCFWELNYDLNGEKEEIINLAEAKRQEIIKSDKFLTDTKNYKHHPESFYISRLLNESIQQAESLLNLSSTEIGSKDYYIEDNNDNIDGLSDKKKNYKHHPESLYTSCPSSGSTQQVESSNLSS